MAGKRRARRGHARHANRRRARNAARGNNFMEDGARDFSEEISELGRKFGKDAGEWGRQLGRDMEESGGKISAWLGFIMSVTFGIIALLLFILALGFVNTMMNSMILTNVTAFLIQNLGLLVILSVLSAVANRFGRYRSSTISLLVIPLAAAYNTGIVWFIASIIRIVNASTSIVAVTGLMQGLLDHLDIIFFLFILLGILKHSKSHRFYEVREAKGKYENRAGKGRMRRLYRSGNDRILGGVCGGIAEYLGIDPTIVRLLWILFMLMGGAGVLLYIIAWIIIPRNPKHKWK